MLIISMTWILPINTSYAQNAIILDKGDIAPFRGALLKEEVLSDLVKAKKKEPLLKDLVANQELRANSLENDNKRLTKELRNTKIGNAVDNIYYLVIGIVVTSIIYEVKR